ncbi:alpha/beta hydrolase [Luteimonas sp. SMYT11W]|uniref:Alpha/beta hydrolase n=1 Tax=Luteimonas flava TaxID=3115822 RepID=A0ABU7WFP5_9GAMM
MRALILPGMDGSGALLTDFIAALAPDIAAEVVSFPSDSLLGYDALLPFALDRLPRETPFLLIGESFSGPLAMRIAALRPQGLIALVLCATFATSPRPRLRRLRPILRLPLPMPPLEMLMPLMMGRWTTPTWTFRQQNAMRGLTASVVRHRLSEVLGVNETESLSDVTAPLFYLQARHDRLVPSHSWDEIRRIQPAAKYVELEGPHFILQHQPRAAAAAIRQFVSSLPGADH